MALKEWLNPFGGPLNQKEIREVKSMTWQNVINACLAIIMTLVIYENTVLQDQIAILETDIRIIKHTLEIPKERVQFEVVDTLSDDEIIDIEE